MLWVSVARLNFMRCSTQLLDITVIINVIFADRLISTVCRNDADWLIQRVEDSSCGNYSQHFPDVDQSMELRTTDSGPNAIFRLGSIPPVRKVAPEAD